MRKLAGLALPLLAVLVGCSSADESVAEGEDAVRVTPRGDNDPPTITLRLPEKVKLADLVPDQTFKIDREDVELDKEYVVTAGWHDNTIKVAKNGPVYARGESVMSLNAETGLGYTIDLTAFAIRPGSESVNTMSPVIERPLVSVGFDGSLSGYFALFPGEHDVRFGLMDGFKIEGAPRKSYELSLTDYAQRQAVRVTAPIRELPSICGEVVLGATTTSYTFTVVRYSGAVPGTASKMLRFPLKDGESHVFGFNPSVWRTTYDASTSPKPSTVAYDIAINGTVAYLPMSAEGSSPVDFRMGRIDVDDVHVRNSDGSQAIVPGKYAVQRVNADGSLESTDISSCATNSGVDVVPGKYRVTVTYAVPEGTKTTEYTVDTP